MKFLQSRISVWGKNIGENCACSMSNGMPQPALLFLGLPLLHISSISASTFTTIACSGKLCICRSSVVLTCSSWRYFFLMFQSQLLGWFSALVRYRGCHCHSPPCPRAAVLRLAGSPDSCTLEWRSDENILHYDNANAVFLHHSYHSSRRLYYYNLDSRLVPKPHQQEVKNYFILSLQYTGLEHYRGILIHSNNSWILIMNCLQCPVEKAFCGRVHHAWH